MDGIEACNEEGVLFVAVLIDVRYVPPYGLIDYSPLQLGAALHPLLEQVYCFLSPFGLSHFGFTLSHLVSVVSPCWLSQGGPGNAKLGSTTQGLFAMQMSTHFKVQHILFSVSSTAIKRYSILTNTICSSRMTMRKKVTSILSSLKHGTHCTASQRVPLLGMISHWQAGMS